MKAITNEILQDIAGTQSEAASLAHDYCNGSVMDGAVALAKILLCAAGGDGVLLHQSRHSSAFDRWYDRQDARSQRAVSAWLFSFLGFDNWRIFRTFEDNSPKQEIFELLLKQIPYPRYLLFLTLNMIKQIFGLSNDDMAAVTGDHDRLDRWHDELFADTNRVIDWLGRKKQPVSFYAGQTNTFLNLYDRHFEILKPARNFEACYDIGGGFSTSEMARLTGQPFTSLDLLSPLFSDYDPALIIRKRVHSEKRHGYDHLGFCLNDREVEDYLQRQSAVSWMEFDVSLKSIPEDFESYFITSTGFMTSTVRPSTALKREWYNGHIDMDVGYIATSLVAMYRIIELVAAGKHVQLLSVNRAGARFYRNKVVLLEWKNGRIVKYASIPSKGSAQGVLDKFSAGVG